MTTSQKLAVVTGASSGIGFELAKCFAQNGFDLLVVAEDAGIESAAASIRQLGGQVTAIQEDLSTREGVDRTYAAIQQAGRPLDALVLNAGIGVGGPFIETDMEKEQTLIDLNVSSTVRLAKYVLPEMKARNAGGILFTASVVSEMPGPFQAVYAASKAFVLSFAVALRNELKDTDIVITALQPGATETNFFHRAGLDDTKVGQSKKDDPADVAKEGFEAFMAGKQSVVASSLKSKALGMVGNVLPDSVKADLHRGMSEPRSARK